MLRFLLGPLPFVEFSVLSFAICCIFCSVLSHLLHFLYFFSFLIFLYVIVLCGKFGSPYPGKAQPPQEQRYPFLSVCAVFSCVQTMVGCGIFNVRTDVVDACDCTRGLYGHRKRVCAEKLTLGEKFLAAPGTRTRVRIAQSFSVGRSTN